MKMIFLFKTKINILKKCEFNKARLEAMFSKRHTLRKHVHVSHATYAQTHTHQAPFAHTIMLNMSHTISMFMFHIHIMHLCMAEFILALIVAGRVT